MSIRHFVERDHPRWPAKTAGSKGGEFRGKPGGDWADRLSGIAGGGSVRTGLIIQCPYCERDVKIVGNGKLSTHKDRGMRCPGSGMNASDADARLRRAPEIEPPVRAPRRSPRKATGATRRRPPGPKPPPLPAGPRGAAGAPVEGEAAERLAMWRAAQTGNPASDRVSRLAHARYQIHAWAASLRRAKDNAEVGLRSQMVREGFDPNDPDARDAFGYDTKILQSTHYARESLADHRAGLALLESMPAAPPWESNPDWGSVQPRYQDLARRVAGMDRERAIHYATGWTEHTRHEVMLAAGITPEQQESLVEPSHAAEALVDRLHGSLQRPFDPANPLAYYGDMIHAEDDSWHTYGVLGELEQRVPPVFHQVMAEYLAYRRIYGGPNSAGIWISVHKKLPQLDDLGDMAGKHPRGWHRDATWEDVDGVVSDQHVMAVSYTPNTVSHRRSREQAAALAGVSAPDASAGLHEFGHLLDSALGYYQNNRHASPKKASEQRLWRLMYGRIKRDAGNRLSPYFRQSGDAGPSELWADAFGAWAAVEPEPATYQTGPGIRAATKRDIYLSHTYGISIATAVDLADYFDRIRAEVEAGRRIPMIFAEAPR